MNLKFKITVLFLIIISLSSYSQKIYTVEYKSQADVKVFVVQYESEADLKIFKVDYKSVAKENKGLWYFFEI